MNRLIRLAIGFVSIAALAASSVLVWALSEPVPPSLYRPELKREMTQEQRWALDFELANETSMQFNTRRFDVPDPFEKRARWVEQEAVTYQIADLIQQILDIRIGKPRGNEAAFNQLVELGKQGDAGASCMADWLYQQHTLEMTARWKHGREEVTRQALQAKAATGHPVCAGMEARFYLHGEMGYPKDRAKAKPFLIEGAVAGFWGDQSLLSATHLIKDQVIDPKEVELQLCWKRVADQFSPASGFYEACGMYQSGPAFNQDIKPVEVPQQIKELARKWCKPTQEQWKVTAQDCANLENK
jgi:hypothetical protein